MVGGASPLLPLAQRFITHANQSRQCVISKGVATQLNAATCDRCVPDRPAETSLKSLIARVHGKQGRCQRSQRAETWMDGFTS